MKKSERLNKNDRQERILAELRAGPTVRVSELAEAFGVTTETVRRDMDELTRRGLVDRTYGGAATRAMAAEPAMRERDLLSVPERERIARAAVTFVEPGDVLMIDNGSTTAHFARRLASEGSRLTVITNSYTVATACGRNKTIRVVVCPGEFHPDEGGVYGEDTLAFIRRFRADKAIIGAGGLTPEGVTDVDSGACWVKRTMIERTESRFLLLDSGKYNAKLLEVVCPLSDINQLISDKEPVGKLRESIIKAGVKVLNAD
ncbi:MAG: DeoR/GlpR family DNA-binding transcription regulator [bacterium]